MPSSVQAEPAGSAPVVLLVLDAGVVVAAGGGVEVVVGAGTGVVVVDVASGVGTTIMVLVLVVVAAGAAAVAVATNTPASVLGVGVVACAVVAMVTEADGVLPPLTWVPSSFPMVFELQPLGPLFQPVRRFAMSEE
jgi:hypothetical protein